MPRLSLPRLASARRRPSRPRPNRRRGAPRTHQLRRLLAVSLAILALLLAWREHRVSAPALTATTETPSEPAIPLVLEVADGAAVTVLEPGDLVDVYAAFDEQPPTLVLSAVELLEVRNADGVAASMQPSPGHIVVGITAANAELVEILLSAGSITATVSAVHL